MPRKSSWVRCTYLLQQKLRNQLCLPQTESFYAHGRHRRIISTRQHVQLLGINKEDRRRTAIHELSCPVTRWRWDLTGILIRSASSVSSTGERDRRKNASRAALVFVRVALFFCVCSILMLVSSSRMRCCVVEFSGALLQTKFGLLLLGRWWEGCWSRGITGARGSCVSLCSCLWRWVVVRQRTGKT